MAIIVTLKVLRPIGNQKTVGSAVLNQFQLLFIYV
jgi:hypothetical protein